MAGRVWVGFAGRRVGASAAQAPQHAAMGEAASRKLREAAYIFLIKNRHSQIDYENQNELVLLIRFIHKCKITNPVRALTDSP